MKKLLRKLFIPEANAKARIVSLWFQMIMVCAMIWIPFFSIPAAVIIWFVYLVLWGITIYDQWLEMERERMEENAKRSGL